MSSREIVVFRNLRTLIAMALTLCAASFGAALLAPVADAQGAPTCAGAVGGPVVVVDPLGPFATPTATADTTDTATLEPAVGASNAEAAEAPVTNNDCADAVAYPGPFTNMPSVAASPYAAPRAIAAPVPAPDPPVVATPLAEPDLAHSGSEIVVLGYLGTGLLAFGAVALGLRRGVAE